MPLRVFALNCTLKTSASASSTDRLLSLVLDELAGLDVGTDRARVADFNVMPGVTSDEGDGDEWPDLRRQVLDADILVLGTPIWMGQPSSVCKRVLERMDALLGELDDQGRMPSFDKVAVVATVGNEDGAHHVAAELFQALVDVGFTIPASAQTYWVGEAMGSTDFKDLDEVPDNVMGTAKTVAHHACHLAGLLQTAPYPGELE